MNMQNYFRTSLGLTLSICFLANIIFAQNLDIQRPREEVLLNDLKLFIWPDQSAQKVTVKLRIHSGSAFDPKDKMGTLALLADIIFPDEGIKTFFEDELDGSLEINADYDYIQINATAKPSEFLTLLETIAPAIINPTIDKETLDRAKIKRLEIVKELENSPSYIAERTAAQNLLGDFPYGRPKEGTSESIQKVDFADLVFAKQRFLAADNATLAIIGNVKSTFAYRAVRRHFGGWAKRTEKIPFSFRLPDAPDEKLSIIPVAEKDVSELRFAAMDVSRNDSDYFQNLLLASVLKSRMGAGTKNSVDLKINVLPSYIVFNFTDWKAGSIEMKGKKISISGDFSSDVDKLLDKPVTETEFSNAKQSISNLYQKRSVSELFLDVQTFRLGSVKNDWNALQKVSLSDVNNAAGELKAAKFSKALVVSKAEEPKIEQNPDPDDPK